MGLFDRLFAKDPTADWPAFSGRTPAIDLDRLAFGPLKLGDPFEGARAIGRPSRLQGARGGAGGTVLEYDAGGFTLEFREGKLVCLGFTTASDAGGVPAAVSLGGLSLTERTTQQDIRAWCGEPSAQSNANGLTWVEYTREGATLEFEFDSETGLGYVQLYAEGYA